LKLLEKKMFNIKICDEIFTYFLYNIIELGDWMILLIEDSLDIIDGLKFSLEENSYKVNYVTTISEAKTFLDNNRPDLIVLDVSLPDGDGFNLYKNFISLKNIPTIFLTAKTSEEDVVKGLEIGADDYLTKPFSTKELLTRIKKIILRTKKDTVINIKNISFDLNTLSIKKDNKDIMLTALERDILFLLLINKGNIVKRDTILDKIWELTGNDVDNHTVTVYIKRIKDKLGVDLITTVKGIGYKIDGK